MRYDRHWEFRPGPSSITYTTCLHCPTWLAGRKVSIAAQTSPTVHILLHSLMLRYIRFRSTVCMYVCIYRLVGTSLRHKVSCGNALAVDIYNTWVSTCILKQVIAGKSTQRESRKMKLLGFLVVMLSTIATVRGRRLPAAPVNSKACVPVQLYKSS